MQSPQTIARLFGFYQRQMEAKDVTDTSLLYFLILQVESFTYVIFLFIMGQNSCKLFFLNNIPHPNTTFVQCGTYFLILVKR